MTMKIEPIGSFPQLAQAAEARSIAPGGARMGGAQMTGGASTDFSEVAMNAINGVDQAQLSANAQVEKLAHGEGNLHEAALALEKADISMRLLLKARNKIVEAYQEIMRMPV